MVNDKKKMLKNKKSKIEENVEHEKSLEEQNSEDEIENGAHVETKVNTSNKREFSEEDSDAEEKPRKKKKKKQAAVETTDKKGKKSLRQIKKEKHAQRLAEAQAASKDQLKSQCLTYLSQWKHDKQNWKFMKVKQSWLLKNMFSMQMVPDVSWPTLIEYFENAKGNVRNLLLENANKIIKQMDDWTESQCNKKNGEDAEDSDTATENKKPDESSYKRARDLLQSLQE